MTKRPRLSVRLTRNIGLVRKAESAWSAYNPTRIPFDRFQILRFQHMPRYLHGINGSSCRETVGIVSHRIALVVIADGIREVDGVGGIRLE